MRNGKSDLIAVEHGLIPLQRGSFEVDGLQVFLVPQFPLHLVEAAELGVAGPQLLQLREVAEALEMFYRVVADVDDAQVGVVVQARDLGQLVVGDVQLFQVDELVQAGDGFQAI